MKTGILQIKIDDSGKEFVAVLKNDNQFIKIERIPIDSVKKYHDKKCQYLWTNTNKVIMIDGKVFYKEPIKYNTSEDEKLKSNYQKSTKIEIKEEDDKLYSYDELKNISTPQDFFNLYNTKVPCDTKRLDIKSHSVDNFNLKLNKFANFENEKFQFKRSNSYISANFGNLFDKEKPYFKRRLDSLSAMFDFQKQLIELKFKPQWRLISGLGVPNVYETNITLHHIYGVPYIPASSIKGVLRAWVLLNVFDNDESKAISSCKMFCMVFGCPKEIKDKENKVVKSILGGAHQGKVTFFDALPIEKPNIVPDVMTPHFSDWYSKKESAPTDSERPRPIFFLTVKKTVFQFLIGSKYYNLKETIFWDEKTLAWWLKNALLEHGIGAKTAVGYGYMDVI
jgi:CRISPR-associated protein Cmr6